MKTRDYPADDGTPPAPHIPYAHNKRHFPNCGCWSGHGPKAACRLCGAAYEPREIAAFLRWRCYDCGAIWTTTSAEAV